MMRFMHTTRIWLWLCLGLLLGLWSVAVYVTYQERQRAMEITIHPGVVHYGTRTTVSLPPVAESNYPPKIPMVSGVAVRHYAHSGHATMPLRQAPAQWVYTTSSATVKSVGSGGAGGGYGAAYATTQSSSSSRGIRYGSTSVSMSSLALATLPTYAMTSTSAMTSASGTSGTAASVAGRPRRVMPGYEGEDGDWRNGGSGDWWYYDEDHWRVPTIGETRYDETLGYVVVWDGEKWVKQTEYDPTVPVGDTPWILLLLMIGVYIVIKNSRKHEKVYSWNLADDNRHGR